MLSLTLSCKFIYIGSFLWSFDGELINMMKLLLQWMLSISLKFLYKCYAINSNSDIYLICMFHYVIWELWNEWNMRSIEID